MEDKLAACVSCSLWVWPAVTQKILLCVSWLCV